MQDNKTGKRNKIKQVKNSSHCVGSHCLPLPSSTQTAVRMSLITPDILALAAALDCLPHAHSRAPTGRQVANAHLCCHVDADTPQSPLPAEPPLPNCYRLIPEQLHSREAHDAARSGTPRVELLSGFAPDVASDALRFRSVRVASGMCSIIPFKLTKEPPPLLCKYSEKPPFI